MHESAETRSSPNHQIASTSNCYYLYSFLRLFDEHYRLI
jgi:hypothetical protein